MLWASSLFFRVSQFRLFQFTLAFGSLPLSDQHLLVFEQARVAKMPPAWNTHMNQMSSVLVALLLIVTHLLSDPGAESRLCLHFANHGQVARR